MSPTQNANGFLLLEALFVLMLISMMVCIHLPLQQTLRDQQQIEEERTLLYHQFYDYIMMNVDSERVTLASQKVTIDRMPIGNVIQVTGTYVNRNNVEEVMTLYYVPKQQRIYND
ncbi:hypothetical protein SAMN05421839_10110 [Halolactibacillus halophilus]|uniref:Competence protein ComGE n=1 Tax=Halolactibacillus halophilus TaxID=306540 RepID=A0A1I5KRK7_9BACI|nr:hypothetical protein [Halolactibacillus halophilus]GEM00476.1 hypothetical protein HHA03_00080 [Halolactibacillus halophilus]SFO87714.1 hypothetical protein SAMN05421839_10110 [Halolactibacillus halophilus]